MNTDKQRLTDDLCVNRRLSAVILTENSIGMKLKLNSTDEFMMGSDEEVELI